mgnify:FL=1|jgi:hypothetical protein
MLEQVWSKFLVLTKNFIFEFDDVDVVKSTRLLITALFAMFFHQPVLSITLLWSSVSFAVGINAGTLY